MKIVIKIGSALLNQDNKFNHDFLAKKVKEISHLHKENQITIVTSGAVAAGMEVSNLKTRPKETIKLQLLSGEGQVRLINYYYDLFKKENIRIAQVLLTHHNFNTEGERTAISKIINEYLSQKIIPVINENDLISKEELDYKNLFPDNDILTALIGKEIKADLVIILTDVDGLFNSNPKSNTNGDSHLIEEVSHITEDIKKMASNETNSLGLGGMYSKILAAEILNKSNTDLIVANGRHNLNDIMNNKVKRTLFKAQK